MGRRCLGPPVTSVVAIVVVIVAAVRARHR
jgi:flagellin-like protein